MHDRDSVGRDLVHQLQIANSVKFKLHILPIPGTSRGFRGNFGHIPVSKNTLSRKQRNKICPADGKPPNENPMISNFIFYLQLVGSRPNVSIREK